MKILVLSRKELEQILHMEDVLEGVRTAYRVKAHNQAVAWPLVEHHFESGAVMDIRSGGLFGTVNVHGAKLLNHFPENAEKNLPVFSGVLMAFDSKTGLPMAIMDASYITSMRTGAAAAAGAAALARKDSETLLMTGAGRQSVYLLGAVLLAMPQLKRVMIADPMSFPAAEDYVKNIRKRLADELHLETDASFEAVEDLKTAAGESDVIVTITRSTKPLIMKDWVRPGTHFSCIGADMVGKEELDPEIFRTARVFADDVKQCCAVGELEIPVKTGIISPEDICGEIGQVLAGMIPGRTSDEDITVFDATGLAALDLVTAKTAAAAAREMGLGSPVELLSLIHI